MTTANRMRQSLIRETTFGSLPASPRMRTERITGESLRYTPAFINSDELRSDRMNADPIKVNERTDGAINFEFSYPVDGSAMSERICSLMYADWVKTPARDNDGTADSVITAVATTNEEVTHVTGSAFVAGHLVRFTGFGVSGNNGVFKTTTGGATTSRYVGAGLTNEAAPPAAARMKVVGFQGASGDITATSTGLGSTSLDFTTLGIVAGQWIKVGGTATGDKFATAALNTWIRVTAVAATALTCDNLPSAWTTDAGTGKTIKVWFGDQIKNGTTRISHSTERSFLGQTVPTHILSLGCIVNSAEFQIQSEQKISGSWNVMALTSSQGTSANGSSYDAATTNAVMAGSVNVGQIAESGSAIVSPNWARSLTISANNNLRALTAVDSVGAVSMEPGDFAVSIQLETYFGSNAYLAKLLAGTVGNVNTRVLKNSQAVVFQVPRVTFTEGSANAQQKNTDVIMPLRGEASLDSTTSAHLILDRLEYVES